MNERVDEFAAGDVVKVIQQIPQRDGECWTSEQTGTVVGYEQKKTGSWYAHAKDDKLWLDRLTVKLEDGEVVVFNLDDYTVVEKVG